MGIESFKGALPAILIIFSLIVLILLFSSTNRASGSAGYVYGTSVRIWNNIGGSSGSSSALNTDNDNQYWEANQVVLSERFPNTNLWNGPYVVPPDNVGLAKFDLITTYPEGDGTGSINVEATGSASEQRENAYWERDFGGSLPNYPELTLQTWLGKGVSWSGGLPPSIQGQWRIDVENSGSWNTVVSPPPDSTVGNNGAKYWTKYSSNPLTGTINSIRVYMYATAGFGGNHAGTLDVWTDDISLLAGPPFWDNVLIGSNQIVNPQYVDNVVVTIGFLSKDSSSMDNLYLLENNGTDNWLINPSTVQLNNQNAAVDNKVYWQFTLENDSSTYIDSSGTIWLNFLAENDNSPFRLWFDYVNFQVNYEPGYEPGHYQGFHDPIFINGNDNFTFANGVTSGSGTESDPYIIENWVINAGNCNGIIVNNTTAYFIIRNCFIENGARYWSEGNYIGYNGIRLDHVINGNIENCTVNNSYNGIDLESSENNNVINNTCENNGSNGILIGSFSNNNAITNNTCHNNSDSGIKLYSSNNIITNNTCSSNGAGFWLYGITIYGGQFSYTENNRIYHNNILNNTIQAHDLSFNHWENGYPSGGNYWSDYTGSDNYHGENQNIQSGDGIGDTPYLISGDSNQDRYPLMNPWPCSIENYFPFDRNLLGGWNLVGFTAVDPVNDTPNNVFQGLTYLTDYLIYRYKVGSGYQLQSASELLNDNIAYWVWINQNKTVGTSGVPPAGRDIHLISGWNLVHFTVADNTTTPNNVFSGLIYLTDYVIYRYKMGAGYQLQGASEPLKDDTGYWVWIDENWIARVPWKDTLICDEIGDLDSLDPAWCYDTRSSEVIQNVYETLISFKDGRTDQFDPRLADNWTISADGLTYTFKIRSGVKFQNGDDLTPKDVVYSIKRAMVQDRNGGPVWMLLEPLIGVGTMSTRDENGNIAVPFGEIDNAVNVENGLVVFHLKQPYGPFMQILTQSWASIVDENWCIAQGDWPGTAETYENFNNPQRETIPLQEKTNGTGPFKLDRWDHGVQIVLVRNDNYWRGTAKLKSVVIKEVDTWPARKRDLLAGDADFAYIPRANIPEIENVAGLRIIENLSELMADAIFFNFDINATSQWIGSGKLDGNGIPPDFFSDKNVRLGFAYSFDWDTFIRDALLGQAVQPASPVINGLPYVDPDAKKYSLNLAEAENYFKQAFGGAVWENGFKLTILYNTGNDPRRIAAEILKQNIENLNPKFSITVENRDWATYLHELVASKLSLYHLGWQADYADPHNFVSAFMSSGGDLSAFQHYSNPTVDNLISAGIVEADPAKRQAIYYQIQQIYYDDVPSVMLDQAIGLHVERDWVAGWYYNPLIPGTPWGGDYYPIWKD